jgi:hypothetical protein
VAEAFSPAIRALAEFGHRLLPDHSGPQLPALVPLGQEAAVG